MKHVIIHGLRRSGTTILWETLRSSENLRCYDEPFHPNLAAGMHKNHKGTWTELEEFLSLNPSTSPEPIHPTEELKSDSSLAQVEWLGSLCASHTPVVIDIVRGWNRAPAVHAECGEVLSVHLLRSPASWVAAHLLPTGASTFRRRTAGAYRRFSFFRRRGFYDNYQYQTIIEAALEQNHHVFSYVSLSRKELSAAPAYMKLLAFWWGANCTLAQRLAKENGPWLTMTLEEFSRQPHEEVARIRDAAGWDNPMVLTTAVRPVSPSFRANSPCWQEAGKRLGLPAILFDPLSSSTEGLRSVFETGVAV